MCVCVCRPVGMVGSWRYCRCIAASWLTWQDVQVHAMCLLVVGVALAPLVANFPVVAHVLLGFDGTMLDDGAVW